MKYSLLVYDGARCIARALVSDYTVAEARRQMRRFFGTDVRFVVSPAWSGVSAPAAVA